MNQTPLNLAPTEKPMNPLPQFTSCILRGGWFIACVLWAHYQAELRRTCLPLISLNNFTMITIVYENRDGRDEGGVLTLQNVRRLRDRMVQYQGELI